MACSHMLRWIVKEVESPYGSVATMHWAVDDHSDGANHRSGDTSTSKADDDDPDEVQLQVQLETAEDQLGAVLWNSNTVALHYLQRHVLCGGADACCVVELGAGVGCLGIALAMASARVAITDIKELVPLLQKNIELNAARISSRSNGKGSCTAIAWRWGPAQLSKKKKCREQRQGQKGGKKEKDSSAVSGEVMSPTVYLTPSPSFLALQKVMDHVDYVVLCDALYGNPKDWPFLLYTLTEILAANPSCEVINFCEQRVDDVEGDFLRLLEQENTKKTPFTDLGGEDESMEEALTRMRGRYVWRTKTELVSEGRSDLQMTVRATRIRWVRRQKKRPASLLLSSSDDNNNYCYGEGEGEGVPPRKR